MLQLIYAFTLTAQSFRKVYQSLDPSMSNVRASFYLIFVLAICMILPKSHTRLFNNFSPTRDCLWRTKVHTEQRTTSSVDSTSCWPAKIEINSSTGWVCVLALPLPVTREWNSVSEPQVPYC